jgi:hypothetical protein
MKKRISNKEKQKQWASEHYLRNKEKMKLKAIANNKLARMRNKEFIENYLLSHPCVDCGNNNIIVLEFDHVRDQKLYNVSDMVFRSFSLKTIQKEIDKCEIRCANCHRIVTHNRRIESSKQNNLL